MQAEVLSSWHSAQRQVVMQHAVSLCKAGASPALCTAALQCCEWLQWRALHGSGALCMVMHSLLGMTQGFLWTWRQASREPQSRWLLIII